MDKILMYTLREEDLAVTAGGVVNLILRNCVHVTGHEISRAKFAGGGITADGMPVTVKDRIRPGQTLRVTLPEREPKPTEYGAHVVPEKPPEGILQFLYEDEDLVALNKPAGTVVHPTHGHWHDTLGNYLAYYYGEQGEDVVCHVAGRLDMDTSGVLVFAKNRAAAGRLARERADGTFRRTYIAILHGSFEGQEKAPTGNGGGSRMAVSADEGIPSKRDLMEADPVCISEKEYPDRVLCGGWHTVSLPIERVPGMLMKRRVAEEGGESAVTHYRILKTGTAVEAPLSLAEFTIDTGRTHQIRVHMAHLGHPLFGDPLYGSEELDAEALAEMLPGHGIRRHAFLHAREVTLLQPFTGEKITIEAPEPEDFRELENALLERRKADSRRTGAKNG